MIISGLDIGQTKDSTALACLARIPLGEKLATRKRNWRYAVVHLETWKLGTNYVEIADGITGRFATKQLAGTALAPDFGGVGRPVFDLLRSKGIKARMTPVLSTGGKMMRFDKASGAFNVPKIELVSNLQVLLQGGYLTVDPRLKEAARLSRELLSYKETITRAKNQTFGADASQHDDLVSALMLASWFGERSSDGFASSIRVGGDSKALAASAPEGVDAFPESIGINDAPAGVFANG